MDTLDPHFAKKVASITSADEMKGFDEQLREDRRKIGQRITTDELGVMIRRGAEIKRSAGRGV